MHTYLKLVVCVGVVLIYGCVTNRAYTGIEPVDPMPGKYIGHHVWENFPVVDSLQPTLKWKMLMTEGFSYDLAVWEKPNSTHIKHIGINYNDPEYYVEDIKEAQHKIATLLRSDTVYMWTVRARKGEEVGEWAVYKEKTTGPGGWRDVWNIPYSFKTPKQ